MTLADLTPQQLHWYEAEWMPKKEANGAAATATAPSSPDSRHTASGARPKKRRRLPRPACTRGRRPAAAVPAEVAA